MLELTLRIHDIKILEGINGNESRAEGENDEMGIPNYRERSRLKY